MVVRWNTGAHFLSHFSQDIWFEQVAQYDLPPAWGGKPDNIIAEGQVLNLSEPTYVHELHLVYSGDEERSMQFAVSGIFHINLRVLLQENLQQTLN
jgi:hypothetical protein